MKKQIYRRYYSPRDWYLKYRTEGVYHYIQEIQKSKGNEDKTETVTLKNYKTLPLEDSLYMSMVCENKEKRRSNIQFDTDLSSYDTRKFYLNIDNIANFNKKSGIKRIHISYDAATRHMGQEYFIKEPSWIMCYLLGKDEAKKRLEKNIKENSHLFKFFIDCNKDNKKHVIKFIKANFPRLEASFAEENVTIFIKDEQELEKILKFVAKECDFPKIFIEDLQTMFKKFNLKLARFYKLFKDTKKHKKERLDFYDKYTESDKSKRFGALGTDIIIDDNKPEKPKR